jgi:hypothetical protein
VKQTYHFQQSRIFDGANRPDPSQPVKKIRTSKGEQAARKKLPPGDFSRRWILIKTTI